MTGTRLPQVDKILRHHRLVALQEAFRRDLLAQLVREELERLRVGKTDSGTSLEEIAERVGLQAEALLEPAMQKVINGTGVILNTNLGRAPVDEQALSDLLQIGSGYCNLEIDLKTGKRGKRSQRIERLLCLITNAEAALVVNNNAAAVVLVVNALARNKKVIVSRGELVEIGGSFRLPDVIAAAGGKLCEIGTTNRTRLSDYQKAIDEKAALLMRCHRSNFEIRGFTEEVSLEQLCKLSAETGVPLLEDVGSGVLVELNTPGLSNEPTVQAVVASGCDLVCFSGDKLLGGPQAGIVVGRKALVEKLAKHPLYRALRLDKLTLALLERALAAYLTPHPQSNIPALRMLATPIRQLQERAQKFAATISDARTALSCRALATDAATGGGSLPGELMDSYGVELSMEGRKPDQLTSKLRSLKPPVIATIQNDRVILDFRTISESDEELLIKLLIDMAKSFA